MDLRNCMDKTIISHGSLRMVLMKKRHVIPMYETMSSENLFEAEAIYQIDLMKTLIQSKNIRPTQARVKKSMLEILEPFSNKHVLDLFSAGRTPDFFYSHHREHRCHRSEIRARQSVANA